MLDKGLTIEKLRSVHQYLDEHYGVRLHGADSPWGEREDLGQADRQEASSHLSVHRLEGSYGSKGMSLPFIILMLTPKLSLISSKTT